MIKLAMHTQPDDESCGPTCLHAIYHYFGLDLDLDTMIDEVDRSISGGTLNPFLGKHALERGFDAILYVYNVMLFDPSWFEPQPLSNAELIDKLEKQLEFKPDIFMERNTTAMIDFLRLGGEIRFRTLSIKLLQEFFHEKLPILTGLSSTFLYRTPREWFTVDHKSVYDDIKGTACGHFVVLCGYDDTHRHVIVADPYKENPISHDNYYKVSSKRLINAIMLGVLTHDANLLIIKPKRK